MSVNVEKKLQEGKSVRVMVGRILAEPVRGHAAPSPAGPAGGLFEAHPTRI